MPVLYCAICVFEQIVEEEALIKNNNTCKDFLIEAMKYHLLPADQRHLIKTDRTRPRTPVSLPKVYTWLFLPGYLLMSYNPFSCNVEPFHPQCSHYLTLSCEDIASFLCFPLTR